MRSLGPELERLVELLAKLPGLGPRSARRAALHLLKRADVLMLPLAEALKVAAERIAPCARCGNLDTMSPCSLCAVPNRDDSLLCVVEEVADLWALERAGAFRGRYHVLGGALSALDGVRPEDLRLAGLIERVKTGAVREVILALGATIDGQTTAHYVTDQLTGLGVRVTRLAQGLPFGAELNVMDDGTLMAAFAARRDM